MTFLDRFEKFFGRFTLPNFLPIWLAGQFLAFLGIHFEKIKAEQLLLNGWLLRTGEWWRMFSFMLMPSSLQPLWVLISIAVAGFMGGSLIAKWGEVRFTLFVGTAWFFTVAGALVFPSLVISNQYILWLLTLAFAHLFPEMEFRLYFFIPVKVKYLGYMIWGYYALHLFTGSPHQQIMVLAATGAWLLFFGGDLLYQIQHRKRREEFRRERRQAALVALHTCSLCGKTNLSHPENDFRYDGGQCYCAAYLQKGRCDHETSP